MAAVSSVVFLKPLPGRVCGELLIFPKDQQFATHSSPRFGSYKLIFCK